MEPDSTNTLERFSVKDCRHPWSWFLVGVEGYARCCCFASCPVGDVSQSSPEEIWNNPTLQSLRATLQSGSIHTVCRGAACKFVKGTTEDKVVGAPLVPEKVVGFDEKWYVANYFDVQIGIRMGRWKTGLDHYCRFGHREFRHINFSQLPKTQSTNSEPTALLDFCAQTRWIGCDRTPGEWLVRFLVTNAGERPWPKPNREWEGPSIRGGARLISKLGHENQLPALHEYRAELPSEVQPGESVGLEIRVPTSHIPQGTSYLIVDMVAEHEFWFAQKANPPLIMGILRGKEINEAELVFSHAPGTSKLTSGPNPQKGLEMPISDQLNSLPIEF